jgi:hypothetical protein
MQVAGRTNKGQRPSTSRAHAGYFNTPHGTWRDEVDLITTNSPWQDGDDVDADTSTLHRLRDRHYARRLGPRLKLEPAPYRKDSHTTPYNILLLRRFMIVNIMKWFIDIVSQEMGHSS